MKKIIAITGGIGAGKSVVSSILETLGYRVYDTDSKAKSLMDRNSAIKKEIAQQISPEAITSDNKVDRGKLAEIVFNSPEKLKTLNSIVHEAVKKHLQTWITLNKGMCMFVECAILYQSGLDQIVDEVWEVEAPEELRIERIMKRNSFTREQALSRINSQNFAPERPHSNVKRIVNDGTESLLAQVHDLLKRL